MKRIQVCFLFVYLEFIVPLENISLIWRRNHCRWRAANFDLCSVLMAIEQWGFVNVPHPLRHGPTVYNGHLRGPVTLTPVAERLAVELSLPVFTTNVCRDRGSNPDLPYARRTICLNTTAVGIQVCSNGEPMNFHKVNNGFFPLWFKHMCSLIWTVCLKWAMWPMDLL